MKNRTIYLVLALIVIASLVLIASCSSTSPTTSAPATTSSAAPATSAKPTTSAPAATTTGAPVATTSAAPVAYKWPAELKIAAAAMGSASNSMLSALAPVLEKSTGMKVRVVPEDSIPLKARWIAEGKYDVMDQSLGEVAGQAIEAKGGYASREGGPYLARSWAYLYNQTFGIFVKGDSGIKTPYDLKGKRVGQWQVPGMDDILDGVLAWGNLTRKDVTLVPIGSYPALMDAVGEGKTDVCLVALPSAPNVQKAESMPGGIAWISLDATKDPAGEARMRQYMPVHYVTPITTGVKSAIGQWGWASAGLMWTRAGADTEFMYNLAKWLDQNYNSYKDLHIQLPDMNMKNYRSIMDFNYMPVHDGVIKYFKEKGMWTADDDVRNAYYVKLVDKYIATYQATIKAADAKGTNIDPQNPNWLDMWDAAKKAAGLPTFKIIKDINEIKDLAAKL